MKTIILVAVLYVSWTLAEKQTFRIKLKKRHTINRRDVSHLLGDPGKSPQHTNQYDGMEIPVLGSEDLQNSGKYADVRDDGKYQQIPLPGWFELDEIIDYNPSKQYLPPKPPKNYPPKPTIEIPSNHYLPVNSKNYPPIPTQRPTVSVPPKNYLPSQLENPISVPSKNYLPLHVQHPTISVPSKNYLPIPPPKPTIAIPSQNYLPPMNSLKSTEIKTHQQEQWKEHPTDNHWNQQDQNRQTDNLWNQAIKTSEEQWEQQQQPSQKFNPPIERWQLHNIKPQSTPKKHAGNPWTPITHKEVKCKEQHDHNEHIDDLHNPLEYNNNYLEGVDSQQPNNLESADSHLDSYNQHIASSSNQLETINTEHQLKTPSFGIGDQSKTYESRSMRSNQFNEGSHNANKPKYGNEGYRYPKPYELNQGSDFSKIKQSPVESQQQDELDSVISISQNNHQWKQHGQWNQEGKWDKKTNKSGDKWSVGKGNSSKPVKYESDRHASQQKWDLSLHSEKIKEIAAVVWNQPKQQEFVNAKDVADSQEFVSKNQLKGNKPKKYVGKTKVPQWEQSPSQILEVNALSDNNIPRWQQSIVPDVKENHQFEDQTHQASSHEIVEYKQQQSQQLHDDFETEGFGVHFSYGDDKGETKVWLDPTHGEDSYHHHSQHGGNKRSSQGNHNQDSKYNPHKYDIDHDGRNHQENNDALHEEEERQRNKRPSHDTKPSIDDNKEPKQDVLDEQNVNHHDHNQQQRVESRERKGATHNDRGHHNHQENKGDKHHHSHQKPEGTKGNSQYHDCDEHNHHHDNKGPSHGDHHQHHGNKRPSHDDHHHHHHEHHQHQDNKGPSHCKPKPDKEHGKPRPGGNSGKRPMTSGKTGKNKHEALKEGRSIDEKHIDHNENYNVSNAHSQTEPQPYYY